MVPNTVEDLLELFEPLLQHLIGVMLEKMEDLDWAHIRQVLLQYSLWLIAGIFLPVTGISLALFLRQLRKKWAATARAGEDGETFFWGAECPDIKETNFESEDSENMTVDDVLHLLDAVMEKTSHFLEQLEKKEGGWPRARASRGEGDRAWYLQE